MSPAPGDRISLVAVTDPLHRLPERIDLTLPEVGLLLLVADAAKAAASAGTAEHARAVAAIRLLTRLLWRELGEILDEDDEEA